MTSELRTTFGSTRAAVAEDAVDMGRQLLVAAGGVVTTLAAVLLNAWLVGQTSFNFLSLSFWLIVPAGALIGGMAAASGYYFVARATQTMPTRQLMWSMVLIALGAWFFSHWLEYTTMSFADGTRVRDTAGFWDFFQFITEHQSLTIRTRGNVQGIDTGELGGWGYAREALQALGFACGGWLCTASFRTSRRAARAGATRRSPMSCEGSPQISLTAASITSASLSRESSTKSRASSAVADFWE